MLKRIALSMVLGAMAIPSLAQATTVKQYDLIVIAGQSNAVGRHYGFAPPTSNTIDSDIEIYFNNDEHNFGGAGSNTDSGGWTALNTAQYAKGNTSNRVYGPEISLARALYSRNSDYANPNVNRELRVFKFAHGGTSLVTDEPTRFNWASYYSSGQGLLKLLQDEWNNVKESDANYNLIGFYWIQGEKDANNDVSTNNYYTGLVTLMDGIADTFGGSVNTVPFYMAHLQEDGLKSNNVASNVVAAQQQIVETYSNAQIVNTDVLGYGIPELKRKSDDILHYHRLGQYNLGIRLADAGSFVGEAENTHPNNKKTKNGKKHGQNHYLLKFSDHASESHFIRFDPKEEHIAAGEAYIDFVVPNVTAGEYDVYVRFPDGASSGIARLTMANPGTYIGEVDQYEDPIDTFGSDMITRCVGQVNYNKNGDKPIRFTVIGKNQNSLGYIITLDKIMLKPHNASECAKAKKLNP